MHGRLVLQQSPPGPTVTGGGAPVSSEREPNNYLFQATDLGDGSAPIDVRARVGTPLDAVDVYRVGPFPGDQSVRLTFAGSEARLTLFQSARGKLAAVGRVVEGATTVVGAPIGSELILVVRGERAGSYRVALEPAIGRTGEALPPLTPELRQALTRTLGTETVEVVPGEIIVAAGEDLQRHALARVAGAGGVDLWRSAALAALVPGDRAHLELADLCRRVRRHLPAARYVSPNTIARRSSLAGLPQDPNDPLYAAQFNLALARFPTAWDQSTGKDDIAIAVVDTGILPNHPDLKDRLSPLGYDFVTDPDIAADGDGPDADPTDPHQISAATLFHGTYVAGVAAASTDNKVGIAGATWRGKIIPIRVFGYHAKKGVGTSFDRIQALRYLAGLPNVSKRLLRPDQRPRVVNMSYGIVATHAERVEIATLGTSGILQVAAVGNGGILNGPPVYPAAWPEVIGVGSVDRNLKRESYSNTGAFVDVVCNGGTNFFDPTGVLSTWGLFDGQKLIHTYHYVRGTSVASALVTGAVALMDAVHLRLETPTLHRVLRDTCRDLGATGRDPEYGYGMLQVDAALRRAKELDAPPKAEVSPASKTLSDTETEATFAVRNIGGRPVKQIAALPVGTPNPAVRLELDDTVAPASIKAFVDRDKVKVGSYTASFQVVSNASPVGFDLSFRKPIPPPSGTILVRLLKAGSTVARIDAAKDGSFRIERLPHGSYVLRAGVDRNGNGRLGDAEEWFLERTIQVPLARDDELDGLVIPWRS